MVTDKTGRKLKIGQIVDVFCTGMFQGKVVAIKENPISVSSTQSIPAHIAVTIILTPQILQNGMTPDAYIIADADPKDPIVVESEKANSKIIRPN